jgi:3-hydroxyisobutyrate dehydrogenase
MVPPGLKNRFEGVLTGSQDGWWTPVLGAKDAGLAIDIARGAEVELPAAQMVQRLYEKAAASGLDQADIAAVTQLYRGQETARREADL